MITFCASVTKAPMTGDNTNMTLLFVMAGLSLISGVLVIRKLVYGTSHNNIQLTFDQTADNTLRDIIINYKDPVQ